MRKNIFVIMLILMSVLGVYTFATEAKIVLGINSVQDMVKTADSEKAIKRLDAEVSAALLKIGKFIVSKKEGNRESKDAEYLLDLNLLEYSESTMQIKKMMVRDAKYAIEVRLVKTSNNNIIVQDTLKGMYSSDKIPVSSAVPDIYATVMEEVAGKISDIIVAELFTISVLKVTENGIITLPNYGFKPGEILNVYRTEAIIDQNTQEEIASENILVCAVVILEVSGSTARAMIPSTVKPYKKYAQAVVEVGMFCTSSNDKQLDQKTLASLIKKMQKVK